MHGMGLIGFGAVASACSFPCGAESELLPEYQKRLNAILRKNKLTEVPITGKYDAYTAGATWWFYNQKPVPTVETIQALQPKVCLNKDSFWQYPCPGMIVPTPVAPEAPPAAPPDEPMRARMGTGTVLGLGAVIALIVYAAMKAKATGV